MDGRDDQSVFGQVYDTPDGATVVPVSKPVGVFVVKDGNPAPPRLTIRVDRTTRGPAAIFAQALASRRLATLVGGPTGSDVAVREVVALPDRTGYTLVTGEYRPGPPDSKVALAEVRS